MCMNRQQNRVKHSYGIAWDMTFLLSRFYSAVKYYYLANRRLRLELILQSKHFDRKTLILQKSNLKFEMDVAYSYHIGAWYFSCGLFISDYAFHILINSMAMFLYIDVMINLMYAHKVIHHLLHILIMEK